MFGLSYLGIVQWAMVAGLARRVDMEKGRRERNGDVSDETEGKPLAPLAAVTPLFASSNVYGIFFSNGTFRLDFYMRYFFLMLTINSRRGQMKWLVNHIWFELMYRYHVRQCFSLKALHKKLKIPILFKYNARRESRFWKNRDYSDAIRSSPPALISTGWHDMMCETSLRDYEAIVAAHGPGHARLLVGPWHHLECVSNISAFRTLLRSSIDFLQEKTGLSAPAEEALPVRVWVMGARVDQGGWRDFSSWPPEEICEEMLALCPGRLTSYGQADLSKTAPSELRYDPFDPTPSLGGSAFNMLCPSLAGERNQAALESRPDVLKFDSRILPEDLCIVGRVRLRLFVQSSRPHFDIFARLCDVHPSGKSFNVCDASLREHALLETSRSHNEMQRMALDDEVPSQPVDLELTFTATAKCFQRGHRIRLLLSGACLPDRPRNCCDLEQTVYDEPLEVQPCTLTFNHREPTPCMLTLPVVDAAARSRLNSKTFQEVAVQQPTRSRRRSQIIEAGLRRVQSEAIC
eukprot:TRINITY_DN27152_c0_g1_i1.p1 TRINITY_DN27152_c0_g1~~TRINITY_DN27152_c0_g1_i1.p1  ORF type:complete len:519 (-),score=79.56 TRINITY_DN27152_c0_g1_i1:92-1648(-)